MAVVKYIVLDVEGENPETVLARLNGSSSRSVSEAPTPYGTITRPMVGKILGMAQNGFGWSDEELMEFVNEKADAVVTRVGELTFDQGKAVIDALVALEAATPQEGYDPSPF